MLVNWDINIKYSIAYTTATIEDKICSETDLKVCG